MSEPEAVAVVGMAGRFPGARTVEAFWDNVAAGRISIGRVSREELEEAGEDPTLLDDPDYVPFVALLDDIELFDAGLFGFSPREARIFDPQHRFFLECCWEALEDAGYDPERFDGRIGVFAGTGVTSYLWTNVRGGLYAGPIDDLEARLGNDKDFLTTWVSYKLGLTGPSVAVQTACSASLVAVHYACQSVLSHEADMVLAGGVTIEIPQVRGQLAREGGTHSRDGRCLPFDAGATGLVSGSGVGVLVLRRLSDALEAGDSVVGVIRGSAVNNDGAHKIGYTAPSVEGQADVVREALDLAGVEPETIDYVEAHGTATAVGDPIEVEALTRAFGTRSRGYCALGSVKANIGHLDAAAGAASLIKALQALHHGVIPPSSYFEAPNPLIDFESTPFFVNRDPIEWRASGRPRRAGVTSLGMGGTNAHAILEEAPAPEPSTPSARPRFVLTVSARTPEAVAQSAASLADHLERHEEVDLADAAFTTNVGRRRLPWRTTVACRDRAEAVERLRAAAPAGPAPRERPPVVFLFPGQGEQRAGMARELHEHEPVFRRALDECLEIVGPLLPEDLRALLLDAEGGGVAPERLDDTALAQPALFAVEYALARLWASLGIEPDLMLGHSIGEYTAACLAGVFSLEDALRLLAARGRLMQELPRGAMVAVAASEEDVAPLLGYGVDLAATNSSRQVVLSGALDAVDAVEAQLDERGVRFRRLKTSHAFHSAQMDPMLEAFRREVEAVPRRPPERSFFSTVTGEPISDEAAVSADYWARHVRSTVRLLPSLERLAQESPLVCLEVGPGATMIGLARAAFSQPAQVAFPSTARGHDRGSDHEQLLKTLGSLWEAGVEPDWAAFYGGERRRRVPLPTYPFERKRHWIDAPRSRGAKAAASPAEEPEEVEAPAPEPARTREGDGGIVGAILAAFRDAFGLEAVGADDDFFVLGGNSLVAIDVMHRLRGTLGVELPVAVLFDAPTASALAARFAAEGNGSGPSEGTSPRPAEAGELSFAQEWAWTQQRRFPGTWFLNLSWSDRVRGPFDPETFEEAINRVVARHEVLRTAFPEVDGGPAPRVEPELRVDVPVRDLADVPPDRRVEDAERLASEEARRPFDVTRGPLVRASVLRLGEDDHVYVLVMHHVVCDGPSRLVFLAEVQSAYESLAEGREPSLPPLEAQYRDFAAWQRASLSEASVEYWRRALEPPIAFSPQTDAPRGGEPSFLGSRKIYRLADDEAACLRELGRELKATPFMVGLAAWTLALSSWAEAEEVVVGAYASLRGTREFEPLVGCFTNTLVFRCDTTGAPPLREQVERVRRVTGEAYAHETAPVEQLLAELQPELVAVAASPVRVLFALAEDAGLPEPSWSLETENLWLDRRAAKVELTLNVMDTGDEVLVSAEWMTDLFRPETVDALVSGLRSELSAARRTAGAAQA